MSIMRRTVKKAAAQPYAQISWRTRRNVPLYLFLLPATIFILVFNIAPLFGLVIAFQKYNPLLGFTRSPFVGLDNFRRVFSNIEIWQITRNTLMIAFGKIVFNQAAGLGLALLLNEVRNGWFKRSVQSVTYALYFLSWIIFGGIIIEILSYEGLVNMILVWFGREPVLFLSEVSLFQPTLIVTEVWKHFGYSAVVYLAALTSIDPALQEAAAVDGAGRLHRLWYVTLPTITPTIVLLAVLSLGSILDAGMEQVLVLSNPLVRSSGEIIDTYIYHIGFQNGNYSIGAAVGLLKSFVGLMMITLSFYLARRLAGYRVL